MVLGCGALVFGLLFAGNAWAQHGNLSDLSAVGNDAPMCEHEVPAEVCTRCNPELIPMFQEAGDWCRGHRVPESQCHRCHPDLHFDPLPPVPEGADVLDLSDEQALSGLAAFAVAGKVTVFDFTAPWCVPCRNVEASLRTWMAREPRVAVRRIHINEWEGPVVDRYLSNIAGLPYVILYGVDGTELVTMAAFEMEALDAAIEAAIPALADSNPSDATAPAPVPDPPEATDGR